MGNVNDVVVELAARGANAIPHPGGRLLEHLVRTSELLRSWGASPAVVLAGLAHAAYGTDGFATALFGLDERAAVASLIGVDGERIVHRYASCDRARTYPVLASGRFHDRFNGTDLQVGDDEIRVLVELTAANELDVVRHSVRARTAYGAAMRTLLEGWQPFLTEAAADDVRRVFGGGNVDSGVPVERDVVVDGIRLHLLEWGDSARPPVVFLHGGGLDAHTWDAVCGELRQDYQCIAVDLRGHGDSEWSPGCDYDLDAHVNDLSSMLDALDLRAPVLVGHSLGGHAALQYAALHPSRLAGLVVIDTSPFAKDGPTLAAIRSFMLSASTFDTFDDALDHAFAFRPDRDREQMRASLRRALRLLRDGRWTWKRDQRHLDDRYFQDALSDLNSLAPLVADVRCPALVVRAEHGMAQEDIERFVNLFVDASSATVRGAGHNVQSDNPHGLVALLVPFLADATAAVPA